MLGTINTSLGMSMWLNSTSKKGASGVVVVASTPMTSQMIGHLTRATALSSYSSGLRPLATSQYLGMPRMNIGTFTRYDFLSSDKSCGPALLVLVA